MKVVPLTILCIVCSGCDAYYSLLTGGRSEKLSDYKCSVEQHSKAERETTICSINGFQRMFCYSAAIERNCDLMEKDKAL